MKNIKTNNYGKREGYEDVLSLLDALKEREESYEQKYRNALERARKIHNDTEFDYEKGMMEEIFPEIKESEDEKTKKEMEEV